MHSYQDKRNERWFVVGLLLSSFILSVCASLKFLGGGPPLGNDNSAHLALATHLANLMRGSETNLFWEHSNLGLPLFTTYQWIPSVFTGLAIFLLPFVAPYTIFKIIIIFFWASMPCAWYLGSRWLGVKKTQALVLALLTIVIRDKWDVGFSLTSTAYTGLYTQVWGLWLLPLTLGSLERSIFKNDMAWPWAAIFMSMTVMSHLFIGLLAVIGLICLTITEPSRIKKASLRLASVSFASFLLCAFWLIPLLLHRRLLGGLPWLNDTYDGLPFSVISQAFVSGELLDAHRGAWMTILAALGMLISLPKSLSSPKTRATILFGITTLLLVGGRESWGSFYTRIPMHSNINPARYITALHIVLLSAASLSVSKLIGWFGDFVKARFGKKLIILFGIGVIGFYQWNLFSSTLRTIKWLDSPLHRVAAELAEESGKRFMVNGKYGTGSHFHRDLLPMLADRAQLQSYAMGYHATFSTYYAEHIKMDPVSLRLFNVNTLLTKNDHAVPNFFRFHRGIDSYKIYRIPDSENWSYFDVVWPGPAIEGDLRSLRPKISDLAPKLFQEKKIAFLLPERPISSNVQIPASKTSTSPGSVVKTKRNLTSYAAKVIAQKGAWLLFKMNYFPFWNAFIDGRPTTVHHVAPNFMAVALPEGEHNVNFEFKNPIEQKAGAIFSLLLFLGWVYFSARRRPTKQ